MKSKRQAKIKEIVENQNIETQEELALALEKEGFVVTQATVSRDIKEMMLVKVPNAEGGYCYAYPKEHGHMLTPERMERTFRDSVINIKIGGNLAVLHTLPGTAQAVAFVIDYMKWPEVMGTVAGDDTIFTALNDPADADKFLDHFNSRLR